DYLIAGGEPATTHIERAVRLSGANAQVMTLAGVAAVQVGAPATAARCWRHALVARPGDWREIAEMAGATLEPDQILDEVLPPGNQFEVWFADQLYAEPEDEDVRARFLRAAIARAPSNGALSRAEQLWIQGQAYARLDERDQARRFMQQALGLEAVHDNWRLE